MENDQDFRLGISRHATNGVDVIFGISYLQSIAPTRSELKTSIDKAETLQTMNIIGTFLKRKKQPVRNI